MQALYRALIVTLCSVCLADNANARRDSQADLCFLWGHRVALLENTLFFVNGNYTFVGQDAASPELYLYSIDLSTELEVERDIPQTRLTTHALSDAFTPTPAYHTEDNGGVMWYTNDTLYLSGSDSSQNNLASYNISGDSWTVRVIGGSGVDFNPNDSNGAGAAGASVSAPEIGLAFAFEALSPGLVRANVSDPAAVTWTDQTSSGSSGVQPPYNAEGEMVYIPIGKQGLSPDTGGAYFPLSQVSVYDIDSSTWLVVTASGVDGIPADRGQFCAVTTSLPDRSSFLVTIFGGWNNPAGQDYEDVWVLTVPSFRWIKVNALNDVEQDAAGDVGRAHHRCVNYNNAQMIVLGGSGRYGTTAQVNETACSSQFAPIRVLNLNSFTWEPSFDPSVNYSVPPAISGVIGGNASGHAHVTEPMGGWNYTALKSIFAVTKTPSSTALATSQASSPALEHHSSNVGAIVGGVIGGVALLVVLLIGAFLLGEKRKRAIGRAETPQALPGTPFNPAHEIVDEKTGAMTPELTSEGRHELPAYRARSELDGNARAAQGELEGSIAAAELRT